MAHRLPWKLVDSGYGPLPICANCNGTLTRNAELAALEGRTEPTEDDCPYCGYILHIPGVV